MRTIYATPSAVSGPNLSPDGTRIAFVTGEGRWKLAEITLADGRVRELSTGARVAWYPSLHPDGTRLGFAELRQFRFNLRAMTLTPSGDVVARTITEIATANVEQVQWAPDGTRILFGDFGTGTRLMVAAVAGGRALPVDPDASLSRDGVWSPDGTQIVYRRRVGDEHQLAMVRVGTSGAPVVVKRWSAREPADQMRVPLDWSSDGRWILTRGGTTLFLMTPDGSTERLLSNPAGPPGRSRPIFSKGGREVLILRRDASAPTRP